MLSLTAGWWDGRVVQLSASWEGQFPPCRVLGNCGIMFPIPLYLPSKVCPQFSNMKSLQSGFIPGHGPHSLLPGGPSPEEQTELRQGVGVGAPGAQREGTFLQFPPRCSPHSHVVCHTPNVYWQPLEKPQGMLYHRLGGRDRGPRRIKSK